MAVFNQSIISPGATYLQDGIYSAQDDRREIYDICGAGIANYPGADFSVTDPGGGQGMNIRVAGGTAYVAGGDTTDQGSYRVRMNAANVNIPCPTAHATNPRLDQVILRVMDDSADGSGFSEARIEIVPGTATAGATFTNRNGAANLGTLAEGSASVLLLADVLVPAAATELTSGDIKDRRVPLHGKSISAVTSILSIAQFQTLIDAVKVAGPVLAHSGMEVQVAVDSSIGITWKFRYAAGEGSGYPWLFQGGTSYYHEILTSETTTNAAYVNLATTGPTLNAPFAGFYEIAFGASMKSSAADVVTKAAIKLAGVAASDNDSIDGRGVALKSPHRRMIREVLAANDVVLMVYKSDGTATLTASNRNLAITPLRVG